MLTDLPDHAVAQLDFAFKHHGMNASVLVEDRDDFVSGFGKHLFKQCRSLIDELATIMGLKAKIYFCLVLSTDREVQACAMQIGPDEYCIAVWFSTFGRMITVNSHLIATEPTAKLFGYHLSEYLKETEPSGSNTFDAYRALSLRETRWLPEVLDSFRNSLDVAAVEWLVLHEMGHIVNGHLAVGATTLNGLKMIIENDPADDEDDNLTSQSLEHDADCFATLWTIQAWQNRIIPLEDGRQLTPSEAEVLRVQTFVYGIASLIRGFDDGPFDPENMFSHQDHPPGGVRINYILSQIATGFLEKKIRFVAEDIIGPLGAVIGTLEKSISDATGIEGKGANFLKAFEMPFEPYHKQLLARWAKLYPELNAAKLNPFKLAPPQYDPA